jgi:hypothetical protein
VLLLLLVNPFLEVAEFRRQVRSKRQKLIAIQQRPGGRKLKKTFLQGVLCYATVVEILKAVGASTRMAAKPRALSKRDGI